jgi:translation elongation factor EF-G
MSSPSAAGVKRIHVYGHASASPQSVATAFGAAVSESPEADSDLAIFAINPSAGIDQQAIENWAALDDYQIPRLVVVNGLEGQELDFDDAVMVANRVFTQLVTPYLVLHDDGGEPTALIRLSDLQIIDYSTNPATTRASDPEHEELVHDFRQEYLEQTSEMDEGAFAAGIIFPAIPINLIKGIGVDVVQGYIDLLPSRS